VTVEQGAPPGEQPRPEALEEFDFGSIHLFYPSIGWIALRRQPALP